MKRMVAVIPNTLSLCRLILGICFPWLPVSWRVPAVITAALTDMLDGATSRYFGAGSETGRVLDPVADKIFVGGVVLTFVGDGTLAVWQVLLVGLRDLIVFAGTVAGLFLKRWSAFRRMSPTWLGKATTAAQFILIAVLLIAPEQEWLAFVVTAILSGLAAGHYLWLFIAYAQDEAIAVAPPGELERKISSIDK